MKISFLHVIVLCCLFFPPAFGQSVPARLLNQPWEAMWIAHPDAALKTYEVYHFRKTFRLAEIPDSLIIHTSADSRYQLYVNGQLTGLGPARNDLAHWNFESYDIRPYLQAGENVIAAVVWNQGEWNAYSQHSHRTAFILETAQPGLRTGKGWKVYKNPAYSPVIFQRSDPRLFWQYYVAGALDSVNAARYPWNWQQAAFDDKAWQAARPLGHGYPNGPLNDGWWTLTPRPLALLERTTQRFSSAARASGIKLPAAFPLQPAPLTIPAGSKTSILLDNSILATGYPSLTVSKGKGATIKISYAEALLGTAPGNPHKWFKGHRDSIDHKKLHGVYDVFMPDGGSNRRFIPLWFRVFRFVQLDIETGDEPLVLEDISYDATLYPFKNQASFKTNDPAHERIFDACLRTIRLASQEIYLDPYYEQMQYIGDTRIQALHAYYHFTDDRLTQNAIRQFDQSRNNEGLTMSRYPSDLPQYTPLYALCWALMVNDHRMLRNDPAFAAGFTPGIEAVLGWFERHMNAEGMLGDLPYLDFLDTFYKRNKILQGSKSKSLTPYTLFYVYTIQQLEGFMQAHFPPAKAARYRALAAAMKKKVVRTCYSKEKGLFSDTPDKQFFSQHANIMAALTGCLPPAETRQLLKKTCQDTTLMPVSLYFKFYLFQALKDAGMGGEILNQLSEWHTMLASGMHTFSEWVQDPRSECHSWSAYPAYYFLNTIAGITPAAPGFTAIRIRPHPGHLQSIEAEMPHPAGRIVTRFIRGSNGLWQISIHIPAGTKASLEWGNNILPLRPGSNSFTLPGIK